MPWPRILADLIVVVHAAFVMFVVLGLAAILVGMALRWEWVRNPYFRIAHLSATGYVVAEALTGVACPLTIWEDRLRRMSGQAGYPGDFVGFWAHRLIYFDAPPWVFTLLYCLFGGAVLAVFLFAPPRWRKRSGEAPTA